MKEAIREDWRHPDESNSESSQGVREAMERVESMPPTPRVVSSHDLELSAASDAELIAFGEQLSHLAPITDEDDEIGNRNEFFDENIKNFDSDVAILVASEGFVNAIDADVNDVETGRMDSIVAKDTDDNDADKEGMETLGVGHDTSEFLPTSTPEQEEEEESEQKPAPAYVLRWGNLTCIHMWLLDQLVGFSILTFVIHVMGWGWYVEYYMSLLGYWVCFGITQAHYFPESPKPHFWGIYKLPLCTILAVDIYYVNKMLFHLIGFAASANYGHFLWIVLGFYLIAFDDGVFVGFLLKPFKKGPIKAVVIFAVLYAIWASFFAILRGFSSTPDTFLRAGFEIMLGCLQWMIMVAFNSGVIGGEFMGSVKLFHPLIRGTVVFAFQFVAGCSIAWLVYGITVLWFPNEDFMDRWHHVTNMGTYPLATVLLLGLYTNSFKDVSKSYITRFFLRSVVVAGMCFVWYFFNHYILFPTNVFGEHPWTHHVDLIYNFTHSIVALGIHWFQGRWFYLIPAEQKKNPPVQFDRKCFKSNFSWWTPIQGVLWGMQFSIVLFVVGVVQMSETWVNEILFPISMYLFLAELGQGLHWMYDMNITQGWRQTYRHGIAIWLAIAFYYFHKQLFIATGMGPDVVFRMHSLWIVLAMLLMITDTLVFKSQWTHAVFIRIVPYKSLAFYVLSWGLFFLICPAFLPWKENGAGFQGYAFNVLLAVLFWATAIISVLAMFVVRPFWDESLEDIMHPLHTVGLHDYVKTSYFSFLRRWRFFVLVISCLGAFVLACAVSSVLFVLLYYINHWDLSAEETWFHVMQMSTYLLCTTLIFGFLDSYFASQRHIVVRLLAGPCSFVGALVFAIVLYLFFHLTFWAPAGWFQIETAYFGDYKWGETPDMIITLLCAGLVCGQVLYTNGEYFNKVDKQRWSIMNGKFVEAEEGKDDDKGVDLDGDHVVRSGSLYKELHSSSSSSEHDDDASEKGRSHNSSASQHSHSVVSAFSIDKEGSDVDVDDDRDDDHGDGDVRGSEGGGDFHSQADSESDVELALVRDSDNHSGDYSDFEHNPKYNPFDDDKGRRSDDEVLTVNAREPEDLLVV